jgi:predicted metal-dependent phosphotriesterase family hydrolase
MLTMLRDGEVLPNIDIEEEVEMTEQEKLDDMMAQTLPGQTEQPPNADGEVKESGDRSAVRSLVEKRLRRLAGEDQEDSD